MPATTVPDSHLDIFEAKGPTYIATIGANGVMAITPVSAIWQAPYLKFSTKVGRGKHANLLADPRVTACVQHPGEPFRYLEVRGRARIEPDPDHTFLNTIARTFLGLDEYPGDKPGEERVTVTIEVEEVTGPGIP